MSDTGVAIDFSEAAKLRGKQQGSRWHFDSLGLSLFVHDVVNIARPAIVASLQATRGVEPAWYHVECDDPDHSGFFESEADALTCIGDHGGAISALYDGPLSVDAEHVARMESVLCRLMQLLPTPKSKKASLVWQEALILAAHIEGRADFTLAPPFAALVGHIND